MGSSSFKLSIPSEEKNLVFDNLSKANQLFQEQYPGDRSDRQPIHTVYGGADLFSHDIANKLGEKAMYSFQEHAPNSDIFARIFGFEDLNFSKKIYRKVLDKLKREPVEDFRIDFEDGFGNRPDAEEDETAENAGNEVAKGMELGTLPLFIGIRIKAFTEDLKERSLRTLDIFLSNLIKRTKGRLPNNFVVMLPKVTIPEQVMALVSCFELLEKHLDLPNHCLKMEMMVETTQSIMALDGTNPLSRFMKASKGRCIAVHFGTYDYTASCNITAKYQEMNHPVCDFAHHMTKVALGHTGVWLSDGATNTMPIGPHRGDSLTEDQIKENHTTVHRAWKKGYDHIRHSLWNGYYQGWDLNPAQLPMRYTAVYAFFLESYDEAVERLKTFVEKAARATLIGDIFDDAATGQGLLNYFLRALNSGAISEAEVLATGLTLEEIRSRSFKTIIGNRKG